MTSEKLRTKTKTFRVTIQGDRIIEWQDERPSSDEPIEAEVVVRTAAPRKADIADLPPLEDMERSDDWRVRSAKIVEALEQLQELDPFKEIDDPMAWQREIRKDKPQPGRD